MSPLLLYIPNNSRVEFLPLYEHYARHIIGMFKDICKYLGMTFVEAVVTPGMNSKNSVRESAHMLESAHAAGVRIMDQNK